MMQESQRADREGGDKARMSADAEQRGLCERKGKRGDNRETKECEGAHMCVCRDHSKGEGESRETCSLEMQESQKSPRDSTAPRSSAVL